MNRKLLSSKLKCPNGCKYCFADFQDYYNKTQIGTDEKVDIIYPSCDSELFLSEVEGFLLNQNNIKIISLSTKKIISQDNLTRIKELNETILNNRKGFIKLSVSFTCKNDTNFIEPKCASYEQRLELLARISSFDIPTSVIFKPILPFIKAEEYYEIIKETKLYTDLYLVGGLYFERDSKFNKDYNLSQYLVENREVNWLEHKPVWPYIPSYELIDKVKSKINSYKLSFFYNYISLIQTIYNQRYGR